MVLYQRLLLVPDLSQQRAADNALAHDDQVDLLVGEVEGRMHRAHGHAGVARVDDAADASQARTLGDGKDVDADAAKRGEEMAGHVRALAHRAAHQREQRHRRHDAERVDLASGILLSQLGAYDLFGQRGVLRPDHDRDGLSVCRLGGHPHGDVRALQRVEHALADLGAEADAARLDVDERHVLQRRHAGRVVQVLRPARVDRRAAIGRPHCVADAHGDARLDQRNHRARVEHLGPEIGELDSLHVAELRHGVRVAHDARIGGHDAAHVGPDVDLGRVQGAREQGRRVVRAVAAQRGRAAVDGAAQEAGVDGQPVVPGPAQCLELGAAGLEVDQRLAEAVVGHRPLPRVHVHRRDVARRQQGRQDLGAGPLTKGQDQVHGLSRALFEERHAVQQLAQRLQRLADQVCAAWRVGGGQLRDPLGDLGRVLVIAGSGQVYGLEQPVRGVAHGGHRDCDGSLGKLLGDQVRDPLNALGRSDG